MKKIAIYRSIFGGYDKVLPVKYQDEADSYLFTDRMPEEKGYNVIIRSEPANNLRRKSRIYKMQPWKYLPEYEYYIYLDGNIEILQSPKMLIRKYLKRYDIAAFKHPWRNCIYDEIDICREIRYVTPEAAREVFEFMIQEDYPRNNGLAENGVILWRNTPQVKEFGKKWHELYTRFAERDQFYFCYVAWKLGIKYNVMIDNIRNNPINFKWLGHL